MPLFFACLFLSKEYKESKECKQGATHENGSGHTDLQGADHHPVAVRAKLNLQQGDKVVFIEDDQGVRILNASALTFNQGGEAVAEKR